MSDRVSTVEAKHDPKLVVDTNAVLPTTRAFERLERHRAGNIRGVCELFGAEQGQAAHGVHGLRAIEQSQPLFRLEQNPIDGFARVETKVQGRADEGNQ